MGQVSWKMFGSSGHRAQPSSGVIESYLHRWEWNNEVSMWKKTIFRTAAVEAFDMHFTTISSRLKSAAPLHDFADGNMANDVSKNGSDLAIHLNHYNIQNYEWFMKVKATRGDVAHAYSEKHT